MCNSDAILEYCKYQPIPAPSPHARGDSRPPRPRLLSPGSSFMSSVTYVPLWQSHSFKSSQPAVSEILPGTSARLVSAICIRSPAHARQSENLQECVSARSFLVSCYAPRTLDTHSPPRGKPAPSTPTQS